MGHFDVVRCLIDAHARVDTAAWRPCDDVVCFDDFGRLACYNSFSSPDHDVMRDTLVLCVQVLIIARPSPSPKLAPPKWYPPEV